MTSKGRETPSPGSLAPQSLQFTPPMPSIVGSPTAHLPAPPTANAATAIATANDQFTPAAPAAPGANFPSPVVPADNSYTEEQLGVIELIAEEA
ncbi:hypothetical protein IV203_013643 [Nitzschia inconspicua]|uniref:Uncharacterized protein n=1 Tax=Nitzschia inconspicua TaxID=303405 RepID=A0A9K3Q860_9STRA|nr:hypothetical protein IV203_013643 [Nitzschia inconspicua]